MKYDGTGYLSDSHWGPIGNRHIAYHNSESAVSSDKFTLKSLADSILKMKFLEYEVAPEWRRFCSFGPEDIGSVWEKIGAIRKRPRFDHVLVHPSKYAEIDRILTNKILGDQACGFVSPVISSPYLKPDEVILVHSNPFSFASHSGIEM